MRCAKAFAALLLLIGAEWFFLSPPVVLRWHPLWPENAPQSAGRLQEDAAALGIFLPTAAQASGAAVIICPGGGYARPVLGYEGVAMTRWLNSLGVAAFVLRYRHAPRDHYPAPMQDLQRALRFVRFHSRDYGLNPRKIGVMGFSAGGHLAAVLATSGKQQFYNARDGIDAVGSEVNFLILGYPVITLLPPITHEPTVFNLLGAHPDSALRLALCPQLHVTGDMPPIFLFHTRDDKIVSVENSLLLYRALQNAGADAELHLFAHGPHGAGLADGQDGAPLLADVRTWTDEARHFLQARHFLPRFPLSDPGESPAVR